MANIVDSTVISRMDIGFHVVDCLMALAEALI